MTIVCGTDFSHGAAAAIDAAAALAARFGDEDVWLVHVLALSFEPGPVSLAAAQTYAEQRLETDADRLRSMLPARVHVAVLSGAPAEKLAEFAEQQDARLIVVSSQGHRASPLYRIGGTSERLVRLSAVPVLVVRDGRPFVEWQTGESPLRVVLGVDPSQSADAALDWLRALRSAGPCDVIVVHVYYSDLEQLRYGLPRRHPHAAADRAVEELLTRDLAKQVGELPGTGSVSFRAAHSFGRIGDRLLDAAEAEAADLIVVGTHRKGGLHRLASVSSVALHFGHTSVACVPWMEASASRSHSLVQVKRVLAPVDLSQAAAPALSHAYGLVAHGGGEVYLLYVAPPADSGGDDDVRIAARLRSLVPNDAAAADIVTYTEIVRGNDVAERICHSAERVGADVVCMAAHRPGVRRALLGSVTDAVIRESRIPVLVMRPPPP